MFARMYCSRSRLILYKCKNVSCRWSGQYYMHFGGVVAALHRTGSSWQRKQNGKPAVVTLHPDWMLKSWAVTKVGCGQNQFFAWAHNIPNIYAFFVFSFSQLSPRPRPRMSPGETTTSSSENSEKFSNSDVSSAADASKEATTPSEGSRDESSSRDNKREASWPSVLFYIHLNILGVYGIFVLFSHTSAITFIFSEYDDVMTKKSFDLKQFSFSASFLTLCGILGATAGAHRLWAHKCYQASTFLRFSLMLCQTLAGQVSI